MASSFVAQQLGMILPRASGASFGGQGTLHSLEQSELAKRVVGFSLSA